MTTETPSDHCAVSRQPRMNEAIASNPDDSLRHPRNLIAREGVPILRAAKRVLIGPRNIRPWMVACGPPGSSKGKWEEVIRASFESLGKSGGQSCMNAAGASLGISAAKLREEIDAGRMQAILIGQRILVPVAAIDEYLELCQKEADEETAIRLAAIKSGRAEKVKA